MMSRDAAAELFNDSLDRCSLDPLFFHRFYARFMAYDPVIPGFFAQTDMQQQMSMLKASLHIMMMSSLHQDAPRHFLTHTVTTHHKRNIPMHLYDAWLQCLMATVAETDPNYNEDIESVWRETLHAGVQYMKSHSPATQDGPSQAPD